MLEDLESGAYASSLTHIVEGLQVIGLSADDDTSSFRSDLVMMIGSLLRKSAISRLSELPELLSEHRSALLCICWKL